MLKKHLALILATAVSACSTNYQVSTNLDKKNFQHYFSAAKVKVYQHEQDIPARHQFIGLVEGQDCQAKPHHAAPDKVNARTQARQQAFAKNANSIVFTGCAELTQKQLAKLNKSNDAQQCHAIIICYGKAYAIATDNNPG